MKTKIILATILFSTLLIGCIGNFTFIDPSDSVNTKEYEFSNYSTLEVSHAFKVNIQFSDVEEKIVIEANDNLHQYIEVSKEGNTLHIGLENGIHVGRNATLKAFIRTKSLNSFSASGASRITCADTVKENSIVIGLSGASYFSGELVSDNLETDLSGASTTEISGSVTNCSISASGASNVKDYELFVDFMHADLSGASNVYVTVNKEINVDASGASHFYYKGGATIVNKDVSGASNIIKKD